MMLKHIDKFTKSFHKKGLAKIYDSIKTYSCCCLLLFRQTWNWLAYVRKHTASTGTHLGLSQS